MAVAPSEGSIGGDGRVWNRAAMGTHGLRKRAEKKFEKRGRVRKTTFSSRKTADNIIKGKGGYSKRRGGNESQSEGTLNEIYSRKKQNTGVRKKGGKRNGRLERLGE